MGIKTTRRPLRSPASPTRALIAIVIGALALRVGLVLTLTHRPTHDTRIFVSWAHLLMQYGNHGLYAHRDTIDHYIVNYPPGFALLLGAVTALYRLVGTQGNDAVLGSILKIPAVVADLALCGIVYTIACRWVDAQRALVAPSIAAFAPFTWPISAIWGQVDSICATFLVAALAFSMSRRYTLAWIAIALSVLFKPLPIVVVPLLAVAQLRDRNAWPRALVGPLAAIALAYVVTLPFAPSTAVADVFRWLAQEYASGQSLTDLTSVNAYNIWTVVTGPIPDGTPILGIAAHVWGWVAVAIVVVATAIAFGRQAHAAMEHSRRDHMMVHAWFIVLDGFFVFSTRMHERYVLFALALTPLLWYCGRVERVVAVTTIATFLSCVVLVMAIYLRHITTEIVPLTHFLSLVNVIAFAAIAVSSFRPHKETDPVKQASD